MSLRPTRGYRKTTSNKNSFIYTEQNVSQYQTMIST